MAELVRVTAYRVERCGFYRRGDPNPQFGSFSEMVPELATWVRGFPVGETSTAVQGEEDETDDALLCSGTAEVAGDWLFEMWHPVSAEEGALASLAADGRVGVAAAQDIRVRAGHIPGIARLFWVLPRDRLLCTVQLGGRGTARPQFQRYIKDFITYRGPWAVTREEEDGVRFVGWTPDPTEEPQRFIPSFKLGSSVDARKVDEIRRRREDIRAILYKGRVDVGRARSRLGGISSLLNLVTHLRLAVDEGRPFRIHVEVPYTPGVKELDDLVSEAAGESGGTAPDVGFRLDPERRIVWLRSRSTRLDASIEVRQRNRAQVHLEELLLGLRKRFRSKLLAAAEEE